MDDEEFVDISIDSKGEVLPKKTDKIALIDADTIVFATCSVLEIKDELLPIGMYTPVEWDEIIETVGYVKEEHAVYYMNMAEALIHSEEKIDFILERTGCVDFELHFTIGRKSFPYTKVDSQYKGNRTDPAPFFLRQLKEAMYEKYPNKVYLNTEWEADHIVVCKKRDFPDKYVLCAVDKDVLKALPGRMFNYYQSTKWKIDMKWIENTEEEAMKRYYVQTLMGDTGDNVVGIFGIGIKTAEKLLKNCKTPQECWKVVKHQYEVHKRGEVDAITNMRLVDMRQLELNDEGEYEVKLWMP